VLQAWGEAGGGSFYSFRRTLMKPIRLLLVDDHALFRKGLVSLLEQEDEFQVVAEAENGAEAIKKPSNSNPILSSWTFTCR